MRSLNDRNRIPIWTVRMHMPLWLAIAQWSGVLFLYALSSVAYI